MRPLVTFQCITSGCGLRLGAIVPEGGRPVYGEWASNQSRLPPGYSVDPGSTWNAQWYLDIPISSEGQWELWEDKQVDRGT